jgi:hypothetical protein
MMQLELVAEVKLEKQNEFLISVEQIKQSLNRGNLYRISFAMTNGRFAAMIEALNNTELVNFFKTEEFGILNGMFRALCSSSSSRIIETNDEPFYFQTARAPGVSKER